MNTGTIRIGIQDGWIDVRCDGIFEVRARMDCHTADKLQIVADSALKMFLQLDCVCFDIHKGAGGLWDPQKYVLRGQILPSGFQRLEKLMKAAPNGMLV
jgi:hypothetical protein